MKDKMINFYDEERELVEKEKALMESQINNMILQINPHFINNTLASIRSLCYENPEAAGKLTGQFSRYLQNNYANMVNEQVIHFSEELKNTEQYLEIEKVRFPKLKVEYDIQCADFYVPVLTVQPLAENAVQHGISRKPGGEGTLRIIAREEEKQYVILIEDDGVGMEFGKIARQEHHRRIGIANVSKRLELLSKGNLRIEEREGGGTRCVIVINKG